ncbi:O-antigen ligase family protein [Sediminicola sp. 1XM1-17]|uniref:O-antigen ligase family protein n=1 Tax=Sediminicola sp. 1XM1-17 TaxID=3127702 RepID=UPI00307766E6
MGTLYFLIGSLSGQAYIPEDIIDYLFVIIKYFIIVIGGYEVVKATSKKELILFLLIGALTVFLQMFVYYNPLKDGGRYSGFYLNPNALGFICMMGYALSFGVEKKYRTIGQIAFTIIGFLTFSRTFIVVWLFINILSIRVSIKNIRVLAAGVGLFVGLLTYNAFLPKKNPRLEAMSNILEGKSQNTNKLEEDSRTHTWAIYYPALMDKPIFGHGWGAFEGGAMVSVMGPHNAYIKTMGEGGILTLLIMLALYGFLLKTAWTNFKQHPHLFLMLFALCLFMATNHSYWTNGYILFFSMWLQYQILTKTEETVLEKGTIIE